MSGLSGLRAQTSPAPSELGSRLLPKILNEEKLEKLNTVNVLDFGRAYGPSLEFFNQYSCRLCVLDASESLISWSADIGAREEPPSCKQMEQELDKILTEMKGLRFDLMFLWDTLNHLHPHALTAFSNVVKRVLAPSFRGHGFLHHKRGAEQKLRSLGLKDMNTVTVRNEREFDLYAHNRKVINEALGADLHIDHGVLHGDGRLEFMMVNGRQPQRGAVSIKP